MLPVFTSFCVKWIGKLSRRFLFKLRQTKVSVGHYGIGSAEPPVVKPLRMRTEENQGHRYVWCFMIAAGILCFLMVLRVQSFETVY